MKAVLEALNNVMEEVDYVQKKGWNAHQKYKYAGEAQLLATLRPSMVRHGLVLVPRVTDLRGPDERGVTSVLISYDLCHKDGEVWKDAVVMAGQGVDINREGRVGDKGVYKAIAGANKYALLKLFELETGDDPEAGESPADTPGAPAAVPPRIAKGATPVSESQVSEFRSLTTALGLSPAQIVLGLQRYGVTEPEHLTAEDAAVILTNLRALTVPPPAPKPEGGAA